MSKVIVIPSKVNPLTKAPIDSLKKRRVAAYARVSTEMDEQTNSYEAQVDYYTKYITANPEWELVKVYTDKGISGTSTKNRDGFNEMIDDARAGKIDLVITKSVSRFARNTLDTISITRELKDKGVEIYFEEQNIYTFDNNGELMLTILASIAQEESRNISENVKWGKRKRMRDGYSFVAFSTFLGYDRHEDDLIGFKVNEKEAETVRLIYKEFNKGKSINYICKLLEELNTPTPHGKKKWPQSTIMSILRNEKYKGATLTQKGYVKNFLEHKVVKNNGELEQYYQENHHECIITPDDWDATQIEIERRKKLGVIFSGKNEFSSKFICECCGGYYGRKLWHSTDKYRYFIYQCNNKFKNNIKCCTPSFKEEELQSLFLKSYSKFMGNKKQLIVDSEELIALLSDTSKEETRMAELKQKADDLVVLVDNLIESAKTKEVDADEYTRKHESYVKEYDALTEEMKTIELEIKRKTLLKREIQLFIKDLNKRPDELLVYDEDTFCFFIDNATIHIDGSVTFSYRNGSKITVK